MSIKLLKIKEVCEVVGVSRPHIYVMMKEQGFPKPVKLSARSRAWRMDAIEAWIDSRSQSEQAA